MADFLLLLLCLSVWSLLGVVFFILWIFGRSDELWFGVVPTWKQWIAIILGGPIVWLLSVF